MFSPPISGLEPVDQLINSDDEDELLLAEALAEASVYAAGLPNCSGVGARYLALGIPGVVCVFVFELQFERQNEWSWVVAGDVPSAAFPLDRAGDAAAALRHYVDVMSTWTPAATAADGIAAQGAAEVADRIRFLKDEILPTFAPPVTQGSS